MTHPWFARTVAATVVAGRVAQVGEQCQRLADPVAAWLRLRSATSGSPTGRAARTSRPGRGWNQSD